MEWSAGVVELARVAATSPVVANYPSRRLVRRNLAIGPELRVWLYRKAQSPSLRNWVVSAFLCAGRFLALLSSTKEGCSNDVSGSRRDHLPKVVGSSRARCEQRVALFKSLETTLDFSHVF